MIKSNEGPNAGAVPHPLTRVAHWPSYHASAEPSRAIDVGTVAVALEQLERAVLSLVDRTHSEQAMPSRLVRIARHQHAMRRRREAAIECLCGEPAWDMLLELYIARAERREVPVKNLCLAAATSISTAMRRLDQLIATGLIFKADDAADARRSLVGLTDGGLEAMTRILGAEP